VACEFSGVVRRAFRERGHDAWSCDLLHAEDNDRHHFRNDALWVLRHTKAWDLLIAHPPCTYLTRAGARWWKDPGRQEARVAALAFVRALLDAPVERIALENPPGAIGTNIRPADQYVQPWQFGHGELKQTGFWLKNLPLLVPTHRPGGDLFRMSAPKERVPRVHYAAPGPDRWKERSRTLPGLAAAMADQWGGIALEATA